MLHLKCVIGTDNYNINDDMGNNLATAYYIGEEDTWEVILTTNQVLGTYNSLGDAMYKVEEFISKGHRTTKALNIDNIPYIALACIIAILVVVLW